MPVPKAETPMMRQFHAIKKEHPDKILFYRMGDFYEMFGEDAVISAKVLQIALRSLGAARPVAARETRRSKSNTPLSNCRSSRRVSWFLTISSTASCRCPISFRHVNGEVNQIPNRRDPIGVIQRSITSNSEPSRLPVRIVRLISRLLQVAWSISTESLGR